MIARAREVEGWLLTIHRRGAKTRTLEGSPRERVLTETDGPFVQISGRAALGRARGARILSRGLEPLARENPGSSASEFCSSIKGKLAGEAALRF